MRIILKGERWKCSRNYITLLSNVFLFLLITSCHYLWNVIISCSRNFENIEPNAICHRIWRTIEFFKSVCSLWRFLALLFLCLRTTMASNKFLWGRCVEICPGCVRKCVVCFNEMVDKIACLFIQYIGRADFSKSS